MGGEFTVGWVAGLISMLVLLIALAFVRASFSGRRLWLAYAAMSRAMGSQSFANGVEKLLAGEAPPEKPKPVSPPPPPPPTVAAKPSGAPLRLLALLQREGRLLDFLLEDIKDYADGQVGASVRDIHAKCQKAIKDHLVLVPVLDKKEGASVDVPAGFDPAGIRLTGNVTGKPPFKGTLQHHGWRVKELKLAAPPEGQDEMILAPAEVEVG